MSSSIKRPKSSACPAWTMKQLGRRDEQSKRFHRIEQYSIHVGICFALVQPKVFWEPLERVRNVVDNMHAMMKIYRPEDSLQNRCACFRLPSPFRKAEGSPVHILARQQIQGLMEEAGLEFDKHWADFLRLVPAAEAHHAQGSSCLESWGKAASDFPELKAGREMITLILQLTHSTCGLERLFRQIPMQTANERAHLLNTTLEKLMIANQAARPDELAQRQEQPDGTVKLRPLTPFLPNVVRHYLTKFGTSLKPKRERKVRRDRNLPRTQQEATRPGPQTEAQFLRDREANLDQLINANPTERCSVPCSKTLFNQGGCGDILTLLVLHLPKRSANGSSRASCREAQETFVGGCYGASLLEGAC